MIIQINVEESKQIEFDIENENKIDFEMSTPIAHAPYAGSYTVTPRVTEQQLPTKDKYMQDNVTVFQIPYQAVSNPAGGKTIIIGLE